MPYRTNDELPEAVRGALPGHAQTIFRGAFNSVAERGADEESGARQAWAAVKNAGYERGGDGKWRRVRKSADPALELVVCSYDGPTLERFLATDEGAQVIRELTCGGAPNYRPSEGLNQCQHCGHAGRWNVCQMFGFRFVPEWTCDQWIAGRVQAFKEGGMDEAVHVAKVDEDRRLVFGFFSINKVGGDLVEDLQGDLIETDTLEGAAYDFVLNARVGGEGHVRKGVARLVESVVLTYEKQEAIRKCLTGLGIRAELDLGCEGWFGGFYVDDDDVWAAVKGGEYPAFSIGGSGKRSPVKD
jgi:cation transport regulator ChaB